MKPLWIAGAVAAGALLAWRWRQLEWPLRVAALGACAAALAYGAGAFELPRFSALAEDVGRTLGPWTYLVVGVLAFLETGAFVGLLVPGETTILIGGVVAGQGEISIVLLIAIVWAAAVAGDCVSFVVGRRLGRGFLERHGPRVQITPQRLAQVEAFFERHGGKAILLGRFVGVVRAVAPFIAGSGGMRFRRFLPYDVLGAGLWAATFCLLGFAFWQSFETLERYAKTGAFALGTTIVVVVGAVWAIRRLRDPRDRREAAAWIELQARRPAVRPLVAVAGPVVRLVRRPLRFAWHRLTPGDLGLELTTCAAVLAVGAFALAGSWIEVAEDGFGPLDRWSQARVESVRVGALVDVAQGLSVLGTLPVVAVVVGISVLLLLWRGDSRFEPAVLVVGLVLVAVAVPAVHALVDRPRPPAPLAGVDGEPFPSSHAALATLWIACAAALARGVPWFVGRAAVVVGAVALAAAVGAGRVVLRTHYASDVLAGWGLGLAILAVLGVVALVGAHAMRQDGATP